MINLLIILSIVLTIICIILFLTLKKAIKRLDSYSLIHELYEDLYIDIVRRHIEIDNIIKTFDEETVIGEDHYLMHIIRGIHNIQFIINTFTENVRKVIPSDKLGGIKK